MSKKSFFVLYWKSILVVSTILYLSFTPPSTFKSIPTFQFEDKVIHFLMYATLTFILMVDVWKNNRIRNNSLAFILISMVFPIALGGIIELMQPTFFAPRTASWLDWLANITGVFVSWLITNRISRSATFKKYIR